MTIKILSNEFNTKFKIGILKEYTKKQIIISLTISAFLISQCIYIVSITKSLGQAIPSITLKIYSHFYKKEEDDIIRILNQNIF